MALYAFHKLYYVVKGEQYMKSLYIKQKLWSLKEKYTVMNEQQEDIYFIEGSFMSLPKRFTITDLNGSEIAQITRRLLSILPKFEVDIVGEYPVTISKSLAFIKEKYAIEAQGIEIRGNWWDLSFEVWKEDLLIGAVQSKIFTWADTYELSIYDEAYENLMVAITVAIDCATNEQSILSDVTSFID